MAEDKDAKMLMNLVRTYVKQAPEQRRHELTILLIKMGLIVALLVGATLLTVNGNFSQDLTTALYVAAFGYLLGTIR